ncbi:MAG: GNAT family N-acetyltransferase [Pseudomonadota bacterium]
MNRVIRPMSANELPMVLDWAAAGGWNPGLSDADPFGVIDPEGLLLCLIDDQPAAAIAAVRYNEAFGVLGLHFVAPGQAGQGHDLAILQAGLVHLGTRTIGIDAAMSLEESYASSGFVRAYRHQRYGGKPKRLDAEKLPTEELGHILLSELAEFDRQHFPADRPIFMDIWRIGKKCTGRAIRRNGKLAGIGVIRACRSGDRLGPIFADDEAIARALVRDLIKRHRVKGEIFLDVPEPNRTAGDLVREMGLVPVFETVRMYRGQVPNLPLERIFAVTSIELG